MKAIKAVPARSANFQPMAPFHPEQVEGSLPIPLGFKKAKGVERRVNI